MKYFWSLLLLTLGIIFLGAEFNYWGYEKVNQLWQFWPLLLIFAGLGLLTRGLKYAWLIMIVAYFLVGLFVYGAIFTEFDIFKTKEGVRIERSEQEIRVDFRDSTEEQLVNLTTGAIKLIISGVTDNLVDGHLSSDMMTSSVATSFTNNRAKTEIKTDNYKNFWFSGFRPKNEMKLSFNPDIPLALNLNIGAADANLDLSNYTMKSFDMEAGASNLNLRLGNVMSDDFLLKFKTGASAIKVEVPANYNVKVTSDSALTSINVPDDLSDPEVVIEIQISSAATSLDVIRY